MITKRCTTWNWIIQSIWKTTCLYLHLTAPASKCQSSALRGQGSKCFRNHKQSTGQLSLPNIQIWKINYIMQNSTIENLVAPLAVHLIRHRSIVRPEIYHILSARAIPSIFNFHIFRIQSKFHLRRAILTSQKLLITSWTREARRKVSRFTPILCTLKPRACKPVWNRINKNNKCSLNQVKKRKRIQKATSRGWI